MIYIQGWCDNTIRNWIMGANPSWKSPNYRYWVTAHHCSYLNSRRRSHLLHVKRFALLPIQSWDLPSLTDSRARLVTWLFSSAVQQHSCVIVHLCLHVIGQWRSSNAFIRSSLCSLLSSSSLPTYMNAGPSWILIGYRANIFLVPPFALHLLFDIQ